LFELFTEGFDELTPYNQIRNKTRRN